MLKTIVILTLSLFFQDNWKSMEWQSYGIEFKVPQDFVITENTDKIFTAMGSGFTMSVRPWKDSTLTAEEVESRAQDSLGTFIADIKITLHEKVDLKGFEGYEVVGSGNQDGKPLLFAVLGFIDPHGDTNFSAYILFWDDPDENDKNIKIAEEIIEGFNKLE
jgi:hypothetical protein